MKREDRSGPETTGPRIRAAAERMIARHGFAAVSMRQIAAEAEVQVGTLYLYVADKQALLFEEIDAHMDALLAAWAAVEAPADPVTRLRAFVAFHIGFHLDRPAAALIARMELRNLSAENLAVIEEKGRAYERELEAILEEGAMEDVFNISDVPLTARAILAMLTGIGTWYREGGRLSRTNIQRIHWRLVRRMVWVKGLGEGAQR